MRMPKESVWLAAGFCFLACSALRASPIITNGSFEAVLIGGPDSSNPADIPGWTHTGSVGDALIWNVNYFICCNGGGVPNAKAGDGVQFVTMGGGFGPIGSSQWSQSLTGMTSGQTYAVSFMMASEGETVTQSMTVGLTTGSSTAPETFTSLPSPGFSPFFWVDWSTFTYDFVASATTGTLQFSVDNQPYDVGLDAVSIAPAVVNNVPEPTTLLLLGTGLAGLGFVGRRRLGRGN